MLCAGLLAWIIEKMWRWVDGELEACISRDELLTNVSLFWFTESITSSMRLYKVHSFTALTTWTSYCR